MREIIPGPVGESWQVGIQGSLTQRSAVKIDDFSHGI